VLGKEEDAADAISTVLLLSVPNGAQYAASAASFWADFSGRQEPPAVVEFADQHSLDLQRAFDILCWTAGSSQLSYEEVAELEALPSSRLETSPAAPREPARQRVGPPAGGPAGILRSAPNRRRRGDTMAKKASDSEAGGGESPSKLIDGRIAELGDWRGETLAQVRAIMKEADPDVVEEWKWRGVPTWYHDGVICTGETYKKAVKMTFAKGASLDDPSGLFNSSLEGNVRRAIDFKEGDEIDAEALKELIRAAVALNES
jgi:hypothetical protein